MVKKNNEKLQFFCSASETNLSKMEMSYLVRTLNLIR